MANGWSTFPSAEISGAFSIRHTIGVFPQLLAHLLGSLVVRSESRRRSPFLRRTSPAPSPRGRHPVRSARFHRPTAVRQKTCPALRGLLVNPMPGASIGERRDCGNFTYTAGRARFHSGQDQLRPEPRPCPLVELANSRKPQTLSAILLPMMPPLSPVKPSTSMAVNSCASINSRCPGWVKSGSQVWASECPLRSRVSYNNSSNHTALGSSFGFYIATR